MLKCDFKLLCNVIEITLRHGFSPVSFRTSFYKNIYGGLLLNEVKRYFF